MNLEDELQMIQRKRPVDPLGQLSRVFQDAIQPPAPEAAPAPAPEAVPAIAPVDAASEAQPPAEAPPAPSEAPAFDTDANDTALGLPPRERGLAALPEDNADTWDVMGAAWRAETIKTDAWNYTEGLRRDLTARMWAALPSDAKQRIADLKWDQQNNWMQFEDLVADELAQQAARDPASVGDLPLSREAFDQVILKQRREELDAAKAVLDQPGGGVAEFIGSAGRAITDQTSLFLLPFGISGSAMRVIAGEAVLGAVGEAAILPREFEVAAELGIESPDPVARIAMGAVLGGALSGAVIGGVKAVQWARNRKVSAKAATPDGVDEIEAEAAFDAAEAQMRGDETVAEVTSRPAPGTLGDIITPAGTRAKVVAVNQGATRSLPIQPRLEAKLSEAVGEVYGPGYTVQVYSGGQPTAAEGGPRVGTDRHDHGHAADVRVYGPDGRQLTGDALAPVIQYWLARRIGGVGAEMSGGGLHLDLHTNKAPTWDYRSQGGQLTPAQAAAMEAGQRGEMPRLGGQIGAPLIGALPNTPGLSYNEDATITAIIGGESSFDPTARNPRSTAGGLGQIIDGTWLELVKRHRPEAIAGLSESQILDLKISDPQLNRDMTAAYARENHDKLTAAGLQAGPGEIYLAHFLGPTGAIRVLSAAPDTPITALMTAKQIADNKGVRWGGRALADFRVFDLVQWSRNKVRGAYGDTTPSGAPSYSPTSRGYTGNGQVRVSDDLTIDVLYEVVDAGALARASGEYQPRDRSRINSDAWIAETAGRLDPAQLMPSPNAAMGTPIVGPDGMIESGNGRFGVIERAYERHPDRIAAYRAAVEQAGFVIPAGLERPVLIARRQTDLTREQRIQMTIDAQDSGVAEMTPTEKAMAFGRAMDGPRLGLFDPALSLTDDGNGGFVRAMLEALPKSARNAMVTKEGKLNRHGEQQLREAIFARAWDDPDMVELFVEADPEELGGLLKALERSVPEWAALKADIEAGAVRPEFDISGHVLDAMRMISAARTVAKKDGIGINKALNDILDTPDLMEGPIAPLTLALVAKFWRNGRPASADATADFLTRYAADARKAGRPGDMFGEGPSPRDVLRSIDKDTFGDLPENLGPVRGYARKPAPDLVPTAAPAADQGFDAGVTSPEAEALHLAIREDLEGPQTEGPFGPIFSGYEGNPREAVAKLLAERRGEATAVLTHPDVSQPIDLVYGEAPGPGREGFGIAKIAVKHPEVMDDLQGFISRLRKDEAKSGPNRIRLFDEAGTAVVRLDYDGASKTWLMTAFEKRVGKDATTDIASVKASDDTAGQGTDTSTSIADPAQANKTPDLDARADASMAELTAARADLDALFDALVELPDGSTAKASDLMKDLRKLDLGGGEGVSARDFLDDLDGDAGADALLQACGLGGER